MNKVASSSIKAPKVFSEILYESDFCELKNWQYDFRSEAQKSKGYNDCLCIVYVRKGNFLFDLAKESYDMHSGYVLIDKPDYEYHLRPSAGACTIFNFNYAFYCQLVEECGLKSSFFFSSPSILSLVLRSTPETDYLHFQIMRKVGSAGKLEIDNLVLELVKCIAKLITNQILDYKIEPSTRTLHLQPIELAKEYMNDKFACDISLFDLADHCCVSPFHFTRIFKKFTSYTPHQYLQNVRLKHGETLLRNSRMPISDIAFSSGFNSVGYFATAFRQKYKLNPSHFRSVLGLT